MVKVGMHSHVPNHNNNGDIIVCGRERGKEERSKYCTFIRKLSQGAHILCTCQLLSANLTYHTTIMPPTNREESRNPILIQRRHESSLGAHRRKLILFICPGDPPGNSNFRTIFCPLHTINVQFVCFAF